MKSPIRTSSSASTTPSAAGKDYLPSAPISTSSSIDKNPDVASGLISIISRSSADNLNYIANRDSIGHSEANCGQIESISPLIMSENEKVSTHPGSSLKPKCRNLLIVR